MDGSQIVRGEQARELEADSRHRARRRPVVALIALATAAFAYVTAEGLPIGLVSPMATDLGVSPADIGLLVTVYGGVVVVASIPLAKLTLRWRRRSVMIAVLALFAVTPIAAALAPSYGALMGARIAMALSQSLFWAAVVPVAAGMFAPQRRGRAIAVVFAGSSLAGVIGLPLATWIGQTAGWRIATASAAVLALAVTLAVWRWMPEPPLETSREKGGPEASVPRYSALIVLTMLGVGGLYVSFTFYALFVTSVAAMSASAIAPLLLIRGLAGLTGVWIGGVLADKTPRLSLLIPSAAQAAALAGLAVAGANPVVLIAASVLSGFAFAALTTALGTAVLRVAPRNVNLAAAGLSAAVNVGIMGGSLLGSILVAGSATVSASSVLETVELGVALSVIGVLVAAGEAAWPRRRVRAADAPHSAATCGEGGPSTPREAAAV
jgi:predicted MFS family arabinose efflux permease